MHKEHDSTPGHHEHQSTMYVIGFVLSILFTLLAYFVVVDEWFSGWTVVAFIFILAVLQLIVQLVFFLHMGTEDEPYWNIVAFAFMLLVGIIVVGGTLWIMYNLDYHMMPSGHEIEKYG